MNRFIFSLLLLLVCEFGFNQANLHFRRLSVDQGLSQTSVSGIIQDARGYIWVTTYDGLNRYDGYNFKIYRHEPNNPNSLAASRALYMKAEEDGSIWVSTIKGISHYDPYTDKFRNYLPDKNDSTAVPFCLTYYGFINGNGDDIWISGEGGFFVLNKKTGEAKIINSPVVDSVSALDSRCLNFVRFGSKFWCSAAKFSFTTDIKSHETKLTSGPPTAGKFISPTGEKLYFCHDESVYLVDTITGQFKPLQITNRDNLNRKELILQITNGVNYDVKNYIWIGGIPFILTDSTATIVEHTQDDFWVYSAWGFCADRTGNIWAGFEDRGLLTDNYYNTKFRRYKFPNPLSPADHVNAVWSITEESDSVIWITTQNGSFRLNLNTGKSKSFSTLNANETGFPGSI
ncbi:MAG: hypothetical protein IPM77_09590 [Crocinitomicaceae bacterium]|nr:hypothetical protein [Crocinitomicaceae bacterium]